MAYTCNYAWTVLKIAHTARRCLIRPLTATACMLATWPPTPYRNFDSWTYTKYQCLAAYDTCRIVSVAWQVLGPTPGLQPLDQGYLLVRRDGWDIDPEATAINGITNAMSDQAGAGAGGGR